VGKAFLEANQVHVRIDESIEVKPNRVYCIGLEYLDDSLQLKGRGQFEILEVSHKGSDVKSLSERLVAFKSLIPDAHRLAIEIEDNQQFFDHSQLVAFPFLVVTLLLALFTHTRLLSLCQIVEQTQHRTVVLI
jgi:hypothetical protein